MRGCVYWILVLAMAGCAMPSVARLPVPATVPVPATGWQLELRQWPAPPAPRERPSRPSQPARPEPEPLPPGQSWAAIATDAASWRELRQRLGSAAAALPAEPCAFAVDSVLVVVTRRAPVRGPLLSLRTVEEDVDVLTFRASPAPGDERVLAAVVVLPKGPSRAIVLALPDARFGVDVEATLLVVPPG